MRRSETSFRTKSARSQSVLAGLRALMPERVLTQPEAMRIAELQAARLRRATGTNNAYAFPADMIGSLPRLAVQRIAGLPVSGVSRWTGQRWEIAIAAHEPLGRQRFTVLHEFKHVIDHAVRHTLVGTDGETAADYFAACVLMPKRLVVRLWGQRVQDVEMLADQFEVSAVAMSVRLQQLGLLAGRERPVAHPAPVRPSLALASAPGSGTWT